MLRELEDLAAVRAFALEDGAAVVQGVREHVDVGLPPGDELAVEPDLSVAVVKGCGLGHQFSPWTFLRLYRRRRPHGGEPCRAEKETSFDAILPVQRRSTG